MAHQIYPWPPAINQSGFKIHLASANTQLGVIHSLMSLLDDLKRYLSPNFYYTVVRNLEVFCSRSCVPSH